MRIFLNDLSIDGQFRTPDEFVGAVQTLMKIRALVRQSGFELYCSDLVTSSLAMPNTPMMKAVNYLESDEKRAWISWITNAGLFWQGARHHSENELFTTEGDVIATNQAIGEAAYCKSAGVSYSALVSAAPSNWLRNPIRVSWTKDDNRVCEITLENHWTEDTVKGTLADTTPIPTSWEQFASQISDSFENIVISRDAFGPLKGYPFQPSVADDIRQLLGILNDLSGEISESGDRTNVFDELYEKYFHGHNPYFTNESGGNLSKYGKELVFPDSGDPAKSVACAWHGKINGRGSFPPIRIHHTWPPEKRGDIYIAYVGPKITTR